MNGGTSYAVDVQGAGYLPVHAQDLASGRLQTVTDAFGNETRFAYGSGSVTVTAPHGQVTTLTLDANGNLARLTGPMATEVTHIAHDAGGLLTDLVDPSGHAHHFDYGADGRLLKDTDAIAGSSGTRLSPSSQGASWSVDITSPEGRVTRHRVDRGITFGDTTIVERRTITSGQGTSTPVAAVLDQLVDGSQNASHPDGTKLTVLETAADPRWGPTAAYISAMRTDVGFPSVTHSMLRNESRTATLASGSPFSVSAQTITTTLRGAGLPDATVTRVFAAGSPATWTTTTPTGRQARVTLDAMDRISSIASLGTDPILHPVQYHPITLIDPTGHFPLPPNPSGLGPGWSGWSRYFSNLNPNGEKWIHKSGDWLEFHKGRPGGPRGGHQKKDHWHHSSEPEDHKYPGDDVPDPPNACVEPTLPGVPTHGENWEEPEADVPFWIPFPSGFPFGIPWPAPVPWFAPAWAY